MKSKFKLGEKVVFCVPKKDRETKRKFNFKATEGEIVHVGYLMLTIKFMVIVSSSSKYPEIRPGREEERYIKKMKWNVNKLENK